MPDPVIKTIDVACTPAHAFDVFVNRIADWWPLDSHAVSASSGQAARSVEIEPRVGGAVYETGFDGTRCDWGEVLEFSPPDGFAMSWHPGTNRDAPTRVEVTFADTGDGMTRVSLTHSGWEIWAEKAAEMRENYKSGWAKVFDTCFASAVTSGHAPA